MKTTIPHSIIKWLEEKTPTPVLGNTYVFGGVLARAIHDLTGAKEDVICRRLREMANEGVLEKTYEQVGGKGPRVVMYRLAPIKPVLEHPRASGGGHSGSSIIQESYGSAGTGALFKF